mmetsp:Transcript_44780/g.93396  ORF Transcript_44780/g.93396 Transcript_44780/m.93396 type:complete len:219 (+) Transcript_44780:127-783(+)
MVNAAVCSQPHKDETIDNSNADFGDADTSGSSHSGGSCEPSYAGSAPSTRMGQKSRPTTRTYSRFQDQRAQFTQADLDRIAKDRWLAEQQADWALSSKKREKQVRATDLPGVPPSSASIHSRVDISEKTQHFAKDHDKHIYRVMAALEEVLAVDTAIEREANSGDRTSASGCTALGSSCNSSAVSCASESGTASATTNTFRRVPTVDEPISVDEICFD